jgi:hypothetical protein
VFIHGDGLRWFTIFTLLHAAPRHQASMGTRPHLGANYAVGPPKHVTNLPKSSRNTKNAIFEFKIRPNTDNLPNNPHPVHILPRSIHSIFNISATVHHAIHPHPRQHAAANNNCFWHLYNSDLHCKHNHIVILFGTVIDFKKVLLAGRNCVWISL